MTEENLQAIIQNKADIAEQIGDWVEDLFKDTFLEAQMIESDADRKQILEAQRNAVQAMRSLRRVLEARKVTVAFKATPEGAKATAEYTGKNYPSHATANGNPIRAYVVNTIGETYSVDGGENNFRGTEGVVGSYTTAEEAIEAAKKAKDSTCTVEVVYTRAAEGNKTIFTL